MGLQDYTPGTQTFTPTTVQRIQQYNAANGTNVGVNMPGDVLPAFVLPTGAGTSGNTAPIKTVVGQTYDAQGNLILIWSDGTTTNTGINNGKQAADQAARQSAWDLLKAQFDQYGLGSLVDGIKSLITENVSPSEFTLRLRQTDAYKQRFAANDARIKNGLKALDEASYLGLEDAYSNLMRKYGLPSWYTDTGVNGRQKNLENFIANDVSPAELEDRIQIGVNRVLNGPKEVIDTLRNFYPGITNGDVLAYVLDPKKALPILQRQVTTAEIGAEATRYGLATDVNRAGELAQLGVNQNQARQGYGVIGAGLQRGTELGNLYNEDYNQSTAEQEIFNMNNSAAAGKKRRKITALEQATFGGSTGIQGGALTQNTAGNY